MKQSEGNPEKKNAATPSQILDDGTVPQIREPETVNTDSNAAATRVVSGQLPAGAEQPHISRTGRSAPVEMRGQVISGKYSIEEKLGEGGMGSVYQAYDMLTRRVVAIKILNQAREISDDAWKRFQQEAHAAGNLRHQNIVRVFDFSVCETFGPYLVMDLIHGEPLNVMIARKGPLPPHLVADLMIQVTDALQHAHDKGVIHRDLKPSNILVSTEDGQPPTAHVLDFGIAKLQGENLDDMKLTKTGEVFGSPLYMSPEQCLASGLDQRTDIYSLGCVMYEALCGEPPFKGKNFAETVVMHTKETPKNFPSSLNIPNAMKRIVFCALEKSAGDRYQSMSALKKELLNFKKGLLVRVKQKRRFWKIALITCIATIPLTLLYCLRDVVKDQPEYISTIFMQYHVPEIVEWIILPDDDTRGALHAVKLAIKDYEQGRFQQAENVLKGILEANPTSERFRRLTAWPLARALARQKKYAEAERYLSETYTLNEKQLANSNRIVGVSLMYQDHSPANAVYFLERSIVIYRKIGDETNAARGVYLMATSQLKQSQFKEAKESYESALAVLKKHPQENAEWIKKCKNGLHRLELEQGK